MDRKNRNANRIPLFTMYIWFGCVFLLLIVATIFIVVEVNRPESYYLYETSDITEYGRYIGNNDNQFPTEFINSFFPNCVSDTFTDVKYLYRAKKYDTYAFEAYLEFRIPDQDLFSQHIAQIGNVEWKAFAFDGQYMEYTLSDQLELHSKRMSEDEHNGYVIEQAKIGKILYNPFEHRIIYVAIGVFDGGGVTTDYLSAFFDRFKIDPIKLASS